MVHIGEISFCDKVSFNIKSDDTKKYLLDHLDSKYGLKIITKHFDKFEERLMQNLNSNPHLLYVRSNGNPYFLYLTKLNFVNYCIFIDKKIQQGYFFPRMIITHFHFDDELFEDTIFDGEMIKMSGEKWTFILDDLIVHKGTYLKDQNIVKRLNILFNLLKTDYVEDSMDVCRFQVKKFFKYDELNYMITEHIPKLKYTCRGIYFRPLFLRFRDVLVNFDDSLIKKVERNKYKHVKNFLLLDDQKAIEKQDDINNASITSNTSKSKSLSKSSSVISTETLTVDPNKYLVRKTNNPDVYEMFDNKGNYVDTACVPTMKISKYMRELFSKKNIVDKIELEFEFSTKFNKWTPIV